MKKCPNCSLIHDDSVVKCTYCGYDFTEEDAVVAEPVNNAPVIVEPVVEAPVAPVPPVQDNYVPQGVPQGAPQNAPQFKYCTRCGNQCDPKAVICVKCGMAFENLNQVAVDDNPVTVLKVLCFLFPIVGLILFLVNKDKKPVSAKAYGKWALIGFVVGLIANVIISIASFIFTFLFNAPDYGYTEDFDYYYSIFNNIISWLR